MDYKKINESLTLPVMGFGTYKIEDRELIENGIKTAIESGYRLIDTARYYNNEAFIGDALLPFKNLRKELIVCTKIWPSEFKKDIAKKTIEDSLKSLKLEYIDIMFLHWPGENMIDAWKVMEAYKDEGLIKHLAVCNFKTHHMEELLVKANEKPVLNQVELHPLFAQKELLKDMEKLGIQVESWSPLARVSKEITESPVLTKIAKEKNKSIAQVIIRWHIQMGLIVIPKSKTPSRIKENIDVFDFVLSDAEMLDIASMDTNQRLFKDPDDKKWQEEMRNM